MSELWWIAVDACFFAGLAVWIWVVARILSGDGPDDRARNR